MNLKSRHISRQIHSLHQRPRGRIVVLTGARQVGKTTLASKLFSNHTLLSMDDPMIRPEFSNLTAKDWGSRYPLAVIDEIQKLPSLMETVKACYDQYDHVRYVLLGSSQITLLKNVRETLAGRSAIKHLYPLTLPELMTADWEENVLPSRMISWLSKNSEKDPGEFLAGVVGNDERHAKAKQTWDYYLEWGGMPALIHPEFTEEDRQHWLQDYFLTYLQRDLADLFRMNDLDPFVRTQQILALKTGKTINYSELGRFAGVTSPTAKKFMRYLEISYQVIQIPAFFRNPEKRLAKQPKIIFLDPGVRRGVLRKSGILDGMEWESAVIAEIWKQIATADLPISCYFLRTLDGKEVDLLLETENGFVAVECKMARQIVSKDFNAIRSLPDILDKPLLCGLVVCNADMVRKWEGNVPLYSVPAPWLLS